VTDVEFFFDPRLPVDMGDQPLAGDRGLAPGPGRDLADLESAYEQRGS
jgi:hypothetical protein